MKSIKKGYLFVIILSIFAVMIIPAVTKAESRDKTINYVALGDSIAVGYGLAENENSYVDLVGEELDAKTINLALSGMTGTELLERLSSGQYDEVLSEADLITVSIGSNDLLKPFISRVAHAFQIDENEEINDSIISELEKKYTDNPLLLVDVLSELNSEIVDNDELYGFCDKFRAEIFPEIISYIRSINRDAQIIADNIYNPYYNVSIYDIYNLGEIADGYINRMNMAFKPSHEYTMADVYDIFKTDGLTNSKIDFSDISHLDFDPHPNKDGHMMIFNEVSSKLKVNAH